MRSAPSLPPPLSPYIPTPATHPNHHQKSPQNTQAVSQLLTGVSLDDYLSPAAPAPDTTATAMVVAAPDATEGGGRQRSDSDIARELQAQFDAGGDGGGGGDGVVHDDDEAATQALIRQLQAEDGLVGVQAAPPPQQQQPAPPPPSPSGTWW